MRHFPRTARQRLAAASVACTLALGALAVPLASADPKDLKDKKREAEQQVEHAEHALEESSGRLQRTQARLTRAIEDLAAARGEYQAAQVRLQAARERDQEMQERLEAAEQRLVEAQIDLAGGRVDLMSQRLELTDTITDIYEQGDPRLQAFGQLLKSQTTADLTRQAELNDAIVGREARAYDDLHAAEVLLEVREGEVEDARDDVEASREEAAAHLVTMENLAAETRDAKNNLLAHVESTRNARTDAVAARKADRQALLEAKRREQRIKQQILAAARRAKSGYNGPTNGLFIRPVPGYLTSPFGYREHPIYHYWGLHDGTDFGVSCGEPMRAIAGGTVIARYWSSVYGNRLYLNLGQINGKNVTAVYNHASSYRLGVGDRVAQGDTVGYVGSTGWSTGCHLHFTILVNGNAVDPMNWLP